MKQQPWPGNVRQLQNVLTQAAVLADGATLGRGDLASALGQLPAVGGPHDSIATVSLGDGFVLDDHLNRLQFQLLQRAMRQANGVKAEAARLLGIDNYQTLAARLKRLGVAGNDKSIKCAACSRDWHFTATGIRSAFVRERPVMVAPSRSGKRFIHRRAV